MSYTHLDPGIELEISERVYFSPTVTDTPTLVTLSQEELKQQEQASIEKETALYEKMRNIAVEWGQQARHTADLRKAQQYLSTPPTPHTSNQWVEDEHNWHTLSNMVYKFIYRIYERTEWDRGLGKSIPVAWELSWYLSFNTPMNPDYSGRGRQLAGQERKVFKNPADMKKYLQGRIKAYAHLFTELSPPIPQEHRRRFYVNGVLLPGYTVEDPNALKPDETKVDELLALLDDDEIDGEESPPPSAPQPKERSPQAIWEKHRKQRTGASQRKSSPVR